jgi:hypothetical protein
MVITWVGAQARHSPAVYAPEISTQPCQASVSYLKWWLREEKDTGTSAFRIVSGTWDRPSNCGHEIFITGLASDRMAAQLIRDCLAWP